MDFIEKAQAKLPNGWDVYTSGGGCYEASKDIGLIGVEVSHEGFANIYYRDEDGGRTYANMDEVSEDNLFANYEVVVSMNNDGELFTNPIAYNMFTIVEVNEIREVVRKFSRLYDEVFHGADGDDEDNGNVSQVDKREMYIATMATEHFDWIALGNTEEEAKDAIYRKWNADDGYDREPMEREELFEWYGVNVTKLEPGECEFN